MKSSVLIILSVTVLIGALAVMNNSCKSGQHAWCAPMSTVRNQHKASASCPDLQPWLNKFRIRLFVETSELPTCSSNHLISAVARSIIPWGRSIREILRSGG